MSIAIIKGSELVQEYKFKDIPFQYTQDYSVRWMEASHRLVILPSHEVLDNPKSAHYTHLLAVDVETRQTYWLPTDEVNLDKTIKLESLRTGYGERRDGLSLYYASPSKQGPRIEFSSVGFSLPILFYKIPWFFSETSGWQWEKTYFAWERKVVYKSDSSPSIVELNQIIFNGSEDRLYLHTGKGASAWVMEGKFLIVNVGSRVLVLGPFIASQDTQSKENK